MVRVRFKRNDGEAIHELRFHLVRRSEGWRIDDIEYPNGTRLSQLLASKTHGNR